MHGVVTESMRRNNGIEVSRFARKQTTAEVPHQRHGYLSFYHFKTCTAYLLSFCTMTQQMHTIISHCYMFRHYRVILRQPVINTLPSYTSILYNEPTNAHNYFTLLHVSTLSCHPHKACNQYLAQLHQYFVQ